MPNALHWTEQELAAYEAKHQRPLAPEEHSSAADTAEALFLAGVLRFAHTNGWLTYHTHNSRRSPAGFPDIVLTDGHVVIIAELKTARGKLTPEQARWLSMLEHTHQVEVYCWRPQDWPAIRQRLAHTQPA